MQLHGRITSVTVEPSGDALRLDAIIGATTINLVDAYDFSANGGSVIIGGNTYPYSTADYVLNTITLTTGLLAAAFQGDAAEVYPLGEVKMAMVQVGADEEGVRAVVPFEMSATIIDGIRSLGNQESVLIDDEDGHWKVKSVDEEIPLIGGRYVDPTDLPDGEPTTPPASSPTIEVTGLPSSLLVRTTVDTAQSTTIEYHLSTSAGFTAGPTTLVLSTRDSVVVIGEDHAGNPLVAATTYYIKTRAINAAGAGPVSPEVSGQLDLNVIQTFVTQQLVAGQVIAAAIQAGGVAVGNITIDPATGITIPQPNGGVIKFPADGTEATITAKLIATALTAANNTVLQDLITLFGQMKLSNGIVDPAVATTTGGRDWPKILPTAVSQSTPESGWNFTYGLTEDATYWYTTRKRNSPATHQVHRILKSTGVIDTTVYDLTDRSFYGMAKAGTGFCTLETTGSGSVNDNNPILIRKYSSAWASPSTLVADIRGSLQGTQMGSPCIGNDGSGNLVVAFAYTIANPWTSSPAVAVWVRVTTYNPTTGAVIGTPLDFDTGTLTSANTFSSIKFVGTGNFDYGSARILIGSGGALRSYNTSGVEQTSERVNYFPQISGTDATSCLLYTGSQFTFFPGPVTGGYYMWKLTANLQDKTVYGKYTWADVVATGGLHETGPSPVSAAFTHYARAGISLVGQPAPQAALSGNDVANMVRFYLSATTTAGNFHLQGTQPAQGASTFTYETTDTASGAAPSANNWGVLGAIGDIESANYVANTSGWRLKGDGTFQLPSAPSAGYRGPGTAQTIGSSTSPTTVDLSGTADFTDSGFTIAINIITVVNAGLYLMNADFYFDVMGATCRAALGIETWASGVTDIGPGAMTQIAHHEGLGWTGGAAGLNCSGMKQLAAGAKVRAFVLQNSGGNVINLAAFGHPNKLNITKV